MGRGGEPESLSGSIFRYTGQQLDAESGLYYHKARHYSAALGRFLQTDPTGYDDDVNLYTYVGNDPLNASDPSGTVCVKGVNYGSPMCVRSRLYESIDGDSRVSNRTRFFAAAAMVTSALATPFASSGFMGDLSARLQQANIARADAIREGRLYTSGSERENTNNFIHFEQSFVQGALDKLKADDSAAYDKLIGEANDNLNGRLTGLAGLADPNFAKGLAANSPDPEKAKAFYAELFQWQLEDMPNPAVPDRSYTVIKVGEGTGGGIMKQVPHGPVGWIPYVLVEGLRVATDKAKSLGGKIMKDVTEVPERGWFSIVQDPAGSILGLWKANPKMMHADPGAKEKASSTGKQGAETPARAH